MASKFRVRLWRAPVVGIAGVLIASCSGQSSHNPTVTTGPAPSKGSPVPVGGSLEFTGSHGEDLTFTLTSVVNPATEAQYAHSPPPPLLSQMLVGLNFKVVNHGSSSATVSLGQMVVLYDTSGTSYSIQYTLLNECSPFGGSATAMAQIAPGATVTGCMAFETSSGDKLSRAVLETPTKTFGEWSLTGPTSLFGLRS